MNKEHYMFLRTVQDYIKQYPDMAPLAVAAMQSGIEQAISEERQKSCDMETLVVAALGKKFKGRDELIKDKLSKWKDKLCLNWDWFLNT